MDIIDQEELDRRLDKEIQKKKQGTYTWLIVVLVIFNIIGGTFFLDAGNNTYWTNFFVLSIAMLALCGVSCALALFPAMIPYKGLKYWKRYDRIAIIMYLVLLNIWALVLILSIVGQHISR